MQNIPQQPQENIPVPDANIAQQPGQNEGYAQYENMQGQAEGYPYDPQQNEQYPNMPEQTEPYPQYDPNMQQQQNMENYPDFGDNAQSYNVPQQDIPQTQADMTQTVQPPFQPSEQVIPPSQ
jgi:hypothetical protein